ncbi:MAG: redoxin domain-containing protein, partial [Acidobacteria bacterium]|nr:redoxin domain-containing protein [Acidobacteriota bacterium]
MKQYLSAVALALVLIAAPAAVPAQQSSPPQTHLKPGDPAPDFSLPDQNGQTVQLSEYQGKQKVALAFYALAFTGGWTREVQKHRNSLQKFRDCNI